MGTRYLLRNLFFFFAAALSISFMQVDSGNYNIQKITSAFESYIDTINPQKIYLHIDKGQYFAGEKIRFNSYVLQGTGYTPDSTDKHIYVELIDPYKRIVQTLRVKQQKGIGSGGFNLSDTIPEGVYQVRAYTNRMKNFGPEFFFNRNITIQNQNYKYLITDKMAKDNTKILNKTENEKSSYYISFFPEGGQLLTGINSKIAFKAVNGLGNSILAQGNIFNNKKVKITTFSTQHNGMGFFYLKPQKGETYYAEVNFNAKQDKKIFLPQHMENAVSLQLTSDGGSLLFHILSNKTTTNDFSANGFILIGQERGKIIYSKSLNLLAYDTLISINKDIFSSGIVHFSLINNRLLPVSERLCFINRHDLLNYSIEAGDSKDFIDLFITPTVAGKYSKSIINASLAVLQLNENKSLPRENIITELLLTSDLPGIIETPLYYFQTGKKEVEGNADLLMLVNGWRRYYWSDILEGNYPKLKYESEQGITLKGKVTREILEFPYKQADIKLFIMDKYNDEYSAVSGENGRFVFNNLNYYDTINAKIMVKKPQGGNNLLIHLEEDIPDEITDFSGDFFLTTRSQIDKKQYRQAKYEISRKRSEERRKDLDSIYGGSIYGQPDYVLWGEDFPIGSSNLMDIIQGRVPGVNVTGNTIVIRGISTIYGSTEPLVLIDGMPSSSESLMSIPPSDVDRIEFLKGPSAAIYGTRGGNGVIAIYTKRGFNQVKGQIFFSILGYHVEEKFNPPSKEEIENRQHANLLPLTIFWAPGLVLDTDRESKISFFAPKSSSKIILVVEGIDTKGNPGAALINLSR
jgi:TonB-dependent SusC/RagA subfamily outer membrane receptor